MPLTPNGWATAIAICESGNNALTWGDFTGNPYLPQAFGRWQMHSAFLWTWANRLQVYPTDEDTLDSWQQRIAEGFYTYHQAQGLSDVAIAVAYHLGHVAQPTDTDWNDQNYPTRFERAAISG